MLPDRFYEVALRLLAALGDVREFPSDDRGIERLVANSAVDGGRGAILFVVQTADEPSRSWDRQFLQVTATGTGSVQIQENLQEGEPIGAVLFPDGRIANSAEAGRIEQRREPSPDGWLRHEHATELILAFAVRLLAKARFTGTFSVDPGDLRGAFRGIRSTLAEGAYIEADAGRLSGVSRDEYVLWTPSSTPDSIRIRCRFGSQTVSGQMHIDGRFDERTSGVTVRLDDPAQEIEPTSEEGPRP